MKVYLVLAALALVSGAAHSQDYVITWNNDTVACTMPAKPRTAGIRNPYRYHNGYLRTLAVFPNDSIRVIEAGDVKAYYRGKHGKSYLCDGLLEARKVHGPDLAYINNWRENRQNPWYFMMPVVKGEFASLYRIYVVTNRVPRPVYLVSRPGDVDSLHTVPVWTWKELYRSLDKIITKADKKKIRRLKRRDRFSAIVEWYNEEQLKTKVAHR